MVAVAFIVDVDFMVAWMAKAPREGQEAWLLGVGGRMGNE
jgi:hypothetical protein